MVRHYPQGDALAARLVSEDPATEFLAALRLAAERFADIAGRRSEDPPDFSHLRWRAGVVVQVLIERREGDPAVDPAEAKRRVARLMGKGAAVETGNHTRYLNDELDAMNQTRREFGGA